MRITFSEVNNITVRRQLKRIDQSKAIEQKMNIKKEIALDIDKFIIEQHSINHFKLFGCL
jgi:hypothetical protein